MAQDDAELKTAMRAYWDAAPCGEVYAQGEDLRRRLESQALARYGLEPYLAPFARFEDGRGRDVLEIGVGMGCDHLEWARCEPRSLTGIDLTRAGVGWTRQRLGTLGLESALLVADAERIPFSDASFDLIYSWGVLHHSPRTEQAVGEVHRILRRGGRARVMIYHTHSVVGYMLWVRYALMRGQPWRSLRSIYAEHLESPGTKAYSVEEARAMFGPFREVDVRGCLSFGDLLQGEVGQRHRGALLSAVRAIWPRWLNRALLRSHGLYLLIDAVK
jgi:SAM-dependent methyltransferase